MALAIEDIKSIIKDVWGYDEFRAGQEEAITPILEGKDVFAVLPTGTGKSLIFQSLALALPGVTIVVSPLIALMIDQVKNAEAKGISATYINSVLEGAELTERLDKFAAGEYKIFYVAPERLLLPRFLAACKKVQVSMVAVDECHCVSRTVDFRPAYGQVHRFIDAVRSKHDVRVLAVTATATLEMETDIKAGCALNDGYARVWRSPVRAEIKLGVYIPQGSEWNAVVDVAKGFDLKDKHIIYTPSRAGAEKVSAILVERANIPPTVIAHYHAGLEGPMRVQVQKDFTDGPLRIIVATCAFGMGVDVPNIRTVTHFGIPASVEDYTQEVGRAGRDGKQSYGTLICSGPKDYSVGLRRQLIAMSHPAWELYEAVWAFLLESIPVDGMLARSGESIAMTMNERGILPNLSPGGSGTNHMRGMGGSVLQVLSNFESRGLISREYLGAWMQVKPLHDLSCVDIENPIQQRVVDWLAKQVGEEFGFDRTAVSNSLKIGELVFSKVIQRLEQEGLLQVSAPYKGKATRMLLREVTLSDHLSKDDIEQRHKRANERLDTMLRYMRAPQTFGMKGDPAFRAFLEAYFTGGLV